MIPGEIRFAPGTVALHEGVELVTLEVLNTGDRPVQVGSHFHFFEVNDALSFERARARGRHLAIPAGTSMRFEPGVLRAVELVAFGGARVVAGFRGLVGGSLDG